MISNEIRIRREYKHRCSVSDLKPEPETRVFYPTLKQYPCTFHFCKISKERKHPNIVQHLNSIHAFTSFINDVEKDSHANDLIASITWLQIEETRRILDQIDIATLKRMTYDKPWGEEMPNILETLCSKTALGNLEYFYIDNQEAWQIIIRLLVSKCPELLTEKCIDNARISHKSDLIDFLRIVSDEVCDNSLESKLVVAADCCYICTLSADPNYLLRRLCACNAILHYECLKKLILRQNLQTEENELYKNYDCMICKTGYKIGMHRGRIICPFDDIYPPPLMTNAESRKILFPENLLYAVWYLQVDRVKELLSQISTKEISICFEPYKQNILHIICDTNMPSNFNINNHGELYDAIFHIIIKRTADDKSLINFLTRNNFGKTPLDMLESQRSHKTKILKFEIYQQEILKVIELYCKYDDDKNEDHNLSNLVCIICSYL